MALTGRLLQCSDSGSYQSTAEALSALIPLQFDRELTNAITAYDGPEVRERHCRQHFMPQVRAAIGGKPLI